MATVVTIVDPKMMIETMEILCVKKARLPNQKLFPLAIMAGVYVGIGAFLYVTLTSEDHSPPTRILGGLGFSTALIMILFVGAELFTGNCLILMSVLVGDVKWYEFAIDLMKVWCGNFAGCILFGTLMLGMGLGGYDATVTDTSNFRALNAIGLRMCSTTYAKANLQIWEMFTRGILANMCVCLAVLQALACKSPAGKVLGVMFPICAFVVFGLEHSIANQFMFTMATLYKCNVQNHGWYWLNLLLSTLGNMVGAFFLATMYYIVYLRHVKEERAAGLAPELPKDEPTYDNHEPADGERKHA